MQYPKILITGALGQLGTVLTMALQQQYGLVQVIVSDLAGPKDAGPYFERLDAMDKTAVQKIVEQHGITQIYHLAAVLSANAEKNPQAAWDINSKTLLNVLEVAREQKLDKVFFPSSIAVFGPDAPKKDTPQETALNPSTVYGISKVLGEKWAHYYFDKYDLDVRSLRYPGIIGHQSLPGGGTTDYAVDIYHKAVQEEPYSCYLREDAYLPMMYIDDAVRATLELMEAPKENIAIRTSYNLQGTTFSPLELARSIQNHYPDFEVSYDPDSRQGIAASWPASINDEQARHDWGWKPRFDLKDMTREMITQLSKKHQTV